MRITKKLRQEKPR